VSRPQSPQRVLRPDTAQHGSPSAGIHLHPRSRQYELGEPVIKVINDLAGELTGDPKYFHIGSSTP
jgi:hypothetical protein